MTYMDRGWIDEPIQPHRCAFIMCILCKGHISIIFR